MQQSAIHQPNLADGLDHRNRLTLARIYQHPLSHNLELRDVRRLFDAIGETEEQHKGAIGLRIDGEVLTLTRPHGKDLGAEDVMQVRHFLERTGWSPTAQAVSSVDTASPAAGPAADMVIIIDHAGARIHQMDVTAEVRHVLHDAVSMQHDKERKETDPADHRFFSDIADVVADAAAIVVISHGTGQSNEGDHLVGWLSEHRKDVAALVLRSIVADLTHMTEPELLALAREPLARPSTTTTQGDPA